MTAAAKAVALQKRGGPTLADGQTVAPHTERFKAVGQPFNTGPGIVAENGGHRKHRLNQ